MSIYRSRGDIEYLLLIHVDDEVLLGLELPGQLLGGDEAEGTFLGLCNWVAFHRVIIRNYRLGRFQYDVTNRNCGQKCGFVRVIVSSESLFRQKSMDGETR